MIREKSWTNDFDDDSGPEEADEDSGFEATEKSTRRHVLEHCASFSVWSWGSNSNYSLGHRNSDDRAYPERLDFNHNSSPTSSTAPLKASIHTVFDFYPDLDQVAISKYHSCVLAEGRLHVCGFGKDGRLGLGHEETVLQLTSLDLESEQRVAFVAVGPDHTVALTVRGRVWTWGSNAFGQLGNSIIHYS